MLADARGVNVSGRYVFVAAGNAGLVILDAAPVLQSPPEIRVEPQDTTVVLGSNAVFSVTASGTQPLIYQWQSNGTNVGGATGSSLTLNNVQANQAGSYVVVVTNLTGSVTSATAQLIIPLCSYTLDSFEADVDGTSSTNNSYSFGVITTGTCPWTAWTTNSWIRLSASTLTGIGPGLVYYDVDANPTADSRTGAIMVNDTNLFTVIQGLLTWGLEVDSASPDAGVSIGVSPRDTDGNGAGPTQLLLTYTDNTTVFLTAPSTAGGNLFQKWQTNGVDATTSPRLSLVIQADLTALAVYSPPVSFLKATYNGLFYETNEITQGSSGSFKITTTPAAKYSGSLQIGSTRYAISGQFDPDGNASNIITNRTQHSSLTVALQIEAIDTDVIAGTVAVQTTNGTQTATLRGDRAVFDGKSNIPAQVGQYTMIIPASINSIIAPGGESWGTVSVDKVGAIHLAGSLADGTKLTQTAVLSKDGLWPLYVPLYSGHGSLISWVIVASMTNTDLSGALSWIKPPVAGAEYYPGRFTMETNVFGSQYSRPPAGALVLSFTNADIVLGGSDFDPPMTNHVTLGPGNKVTSTNKATLTFTLSTGAFQGSVRNAANKSISFTGVVLTNYDIGVGYFLGTNESGHVRFQAR